MQPDLDEIEFGTSHWTHPPAPMAQVAQQITAAMMGWGGTDVRYWIQGVREGLTLDEVKRKAKEWGCEVKFFDEQGKLKGTAYRNGDVQW